jgi:HEPN domain-containing protein
LTAARSDIRAAKALAADADQSNDVIGFHAQQAVEKAIKAVLVASGMEIPVRTTSVFSLTSSRRS